VQPEAKLGHKIRDALEKRGAFVFKVHGGPMMMAGLPDLVVCYRGRYIGLEVKMPGNKPSPIQERVGSKIHSALGEWGVVYSVEEAVNFLDSVDSRMRIEWSDTTHHSSKEEHGPHTNH